MLEALTESNINHFGQNENNNTTFFTKTLKTDINDTETTVFMEHILSGSYEVSVLNDLR